MNRDHWAMAIIFCISGILLLIFVKKYQIRRALFAVLVAQVFSWPITLLYAFFGLQNNPIRLFPHAADGNFLFAFIFHPSVFAVHYLHYPRQASISKRIIYTAAAPAVAILAQFLTQWFTNLIHYPQKWVMLGNFPIFVILYTVSRKYIDWFFSKSFTHGRIE